MGKETMMTLAMGPPLVLTAMWVMIGVVGVAGVPRGILGAGKIDPEPQVHGNFALSAAAALQTVCLCSVGGTIDTYCAFYNDHYLW